MILYYDVEYRAPIIAKVIEISRNKNVYVVRKERDSIPGVTDTDYYVYVHGDQDYSIRINWSTYSNGYDSGFVQFNYECPDMAPLPDMPEMVYRNLDDTTPAMGINLEDSRIAELVRVLQCKSTMTKIRPVARTGFANRLKPVTDLFQGITGRFQRFIGAGKKR